VLQGGDKFVSGHSFDAVQALTGMNEGTDTVLASVSYTMATGVETLTLQTAAGNLNGTGNALANTIVGNDANNSLTGGAGNDILTGGLGSDTFAFNLPTSGVDTITDFAHGTDVIQISVAGFGGGLAAGGTPTVVNAASAGAAFNAASSGYFIFDSTGTLLWDATGGSGSDATPIATVQGLASLLSNDFLLV
jgi:Ca2+-binding RTX toxin-like protein